MIKYRKESDEVLYPDEDIVTVEKADLDWLKAMAEKTPRQRIRLCAHRSMSDHLHEMFIVHMRDCYVRPHKHLGKAESMTVIEGFVDMVLFDQEGKIIRTISMGEPGSGRKFYYRLNDAIYHTLLVRSEFLVFHELTQGPFQREQTVFAPWSPAEGEAEVANFLARVKEAAGV